MPAGMPAIVWMLLQHLMHIANTGEKFERWLEPDNIDPHSPDSGSGALICGFAGVQWIVQFLILTWGNLPVMVSAIMGNPHPGAKGQREVQQ